MREEALFEILKFSHDEPCGGIFLIVEVHIKLYEMAIFSLVCLRTPNNMSNVAIAIEEWVSLAKPMKCFCVLKL